VFNLFLPCDPGQVPSPQFGFDPPSPHLTLSPHAQQDGDQQEQVADDEQQPRVVRHEPPAGPIECRTCVSHPGAAMRPDLANLAAPIAEACTRWFDVLDPTRHPHAFNSTPHETSTPRGVGRRSFDV
jgi:hypothetical protein